MSESLRNDGRVWVPKQMDDPRSPDQIPDDDRDYFLERRYPAFGNLVPRDVASRAIKREVDAGRGVGPLKNGVYLDFSESIERLGRDVDRGALRQPLRDVRAHHRRGPVRRADAHLPGDPLHDGRALGRLQPDEQRARAVRARRGELLRPRRQPARRVGAHAGSRRRLLRAAVHDRRLPRAAARHEAGADRRPGVHGSRSRRSTSRCASCCRSTATAPSTTSTASSARCCGTTAAWRAPSRASRRRSRRSPRSARSSGRTCACSARTRRRNQSLEKAGRVADFLEFGELLVLDALHRNERCGGHFREEYQTEDGEALRDDENFAYVAAWEFTGVGNEPELHKEAARVRVRPPVDPFVQVTTESSVSEQTMHITLTAWRQAGPDAAGRVRDLRRARREPRHVVPRDARHRQRAADRSTARSRSRSTTTAARASAARAG